MDRNPPDPARILLTLIFLGVDTPRLSLLFYMSVLPFLSAWQCESYLLNSLFAYYHASASI